MDGTTKHHDGTDESTTAHAGAEPEFDERGEPTEIPVVPDDDDAAAGGEGGAGAGSSAGTEAAEDGASKASTKSKPDPEKIRRENYERIRAKRRGEAPATKPDDDDASAAAATDSGQGEAGSGKGGDEKKKGSATETATDPEQAERDVLYRRALKRDGWEEKDIDLLPLERLRKTGAHRLKVQTDVDAKIGSAPRDPRLAKTAAPKTAKPAGQPAAKRGTEKSAGSQPAGGARTPGTELDGHSSETPSDEAVEEALSYLDEDQAAIIRARIDQGRASPDTNTAPEPAEAGEERQSDESSAEAAAQFEAHCRAAQQSLASQYPALKETPPQALLDKMSRLGAGGGYDLQSEDGVRDLMEDAAQLAFRDQLNAQSRANLLTKNTQQRNGSTSTKSKATASREVDPEQQKRLTYDALKEAGNKGLTGDARRAEAARIVESKKELLTKS